MSEQSKATGGEELPGMLAVAKGVAEQRWPHTMDAKAWADEFAKVKPADIDYGLMLSWFANAIMAGYDTARQRSVPSDRGEGTQALKALAEIADAMDLPLSQSVSVEQVKVRILERLSAPSAKS